MLTLTPAVEEGIRRLQLATTPEEGHAAFKELAKRVPLNEHGLLVSLFRAGYDVGHAAAREEAEMNKPEEPKSGGSHEELAAAVEQKTGGPIEQSVSGKGNTATVTAPTTTTTNTNVGIGGPVLLGIIAALLAGVGTIVYFLSSSQDSSSTEHRHLGEQDAPGGQE